MIDLDNVLTLTQKELRDARHNRWYLLYTAIFTLLALAMAWFGLSGMGSSGLAGFGRTAASIINLVLLVVPLMGLTLGALSLAGERERGTLLYLLAQPVTPFEVFAGKYLGLAVAMFNALLFGFGISGVLIAWQESLVDAGAYLLVVAFAFLLGLVSLSLGFLISSLSRKGATAISIALFVWLALVFFGDLGLMGTALVLELRVEELFALALANPVQIFKIAAILDIRSSLEVLGPAGLYAVRTFGARLLPVLVGALVAWAALPLAGAYSVFRRRGAF